MSTPDGENPMFTVVKGSPTEDELAAVMTVLTMRLARPRQQDTAPSRGWSAYWRSVRSPIQPGPSAWRISSRPQ
jgi:acyl-CoA carboxylase epsilon subunit